MELGTALMLVALLLHGGNAGFTDIFPRNGGDPNSFDLTTILNCAVDGEGGRLSVPLTPPETAGNNTDFEYWLPEVAPVTAPNALQWVNRDFDTLVQLLPELQGIDLELQALMLPNDTEGAFPEVCADVRSQLNMTGLDQDDDATFIVSTLIRERVQSETSITDHTFTLGEDDNDERNALTSVFAALRCQVVHRWTDLGPTYLPRYYIAGRCFQRGCSFPMRNGQYCRPDVSNPANFRTLPGLRWDCCWELPAGLANPTSADFVYNCGWRRVDIPLLCDCDCSCPPRQ